MKIIFFDRNSEMITEWKKQFSQEPEVEFFIGDFDDITCDTIVSPANSFGFMDGGLDYAIIKKLGWEVQTRLQKQIKQLPEGELLVGKAMMVFTGHQEIPRLISAPTMRVPTDNVSNSIHAYLAMKAVLIEAQKNTEIKRLAVPGFCTGTGAMKKSIAAAQMFAAYREIKSGERLDFSSFKAAQKHHQDLNPEAKI